MDQNYNYGSQMGDMDPREYESYMEQTYGPGWKMGFRVGFGKRLGAFLLDIIIVSVISWIVSLFIPQASEEAALGLVEDMTKSNDISSIFGAVNQFQEENFWSQWFDYLIWILYFLPEALLGFSLGKKLLKIKIADTDLRQSSKALWLRYILKHIYYIIPTIFFLTMTMTVSTVLFLLGFIIFIGCFFVLGRNKQALHDMIAKTAVFNEESLEWSGQNG